MVTWQGLTETATDYANRIARVRCRMPDRLLVAVGLPGVLPALDGVRIVELPPKPFGLLHPAKPHRYRILRGGRGSAKSWSIARALIVAALAGRQRIGCFREFQSSIAESAHRLLADTIESLHLSRYFEVFNHSITAHNGSEFIFEGLYANVSKIRSLEGLTIAWVEEAARVSDASWQVLIPTVRAAGSEIWVNFNPEQESDPAYQRFVVSPPPDAEVAQVDWRDNPWFSVALQREREYLARVDPDAHAHVWGGECAARSNAQVFAGKYEIELFTPAEGWDGPYYGADWGFSQDPTVLVCCWVHERVLYVEHEAYQVGCDLDRTPALFDSVPGARAHVCRADSARPETICFMQARGFGNMVSVVKGPNSIEEGVQHLRAYQRIVVHPRCTHVAEEMRLYAYRVDRLSGDPLPELLDRHNHTIDALRYALQPLIQQGAGQALLQFYQQELAREAGSAPHAWQPAPPAGSLQERARASGAQIFDLTPWHRS
jgi:phage terminase large subunit